MPDERTNDAPPHAPPGAGLSADGPRGHGRADPLRLHIGGTEARPGWRILNVQPGPGVDYVGSCTDLTRFPDDSVEEVYASHVYEHLGYQDELPAALAEVRRVLRPGGLFRVAVPDLDALCRLFLRPDVQAVDRFNLMRAMFGGQVDPYDVHKAGLSFDILCMFLARAGFARVRRVEAFGLFDDCSALQFGGQSISLNVEAMK